MPKKFEHNHCSDCTHFVTPQYEMRKRKRSIGRDWPGWQENVWSDWSGIELIARNRMRAIFETEPQLVKLRRTFHDIEFEYRRNW